MEQDKTTLPLDAQIEGILFWKGEPVRVKKLSQILNVAENDILSSLEILKQKLKERGVILVSKEDEVMLGAAPQMSTTIETLTKEELLKDLGKAGLETISIVLYKGPISRAEIDYIRGVQSSFILRNLLVRGLVEKVSRPDNQRGFLYGPTFELLSYLGISKIEDLPEYEKTKKEFEVVKENLSEEERSGRSHLDEAAQSIENKINGNRAETSDVNKRQ